MVKIIDKLFHENDSQFDVELKGAIVQRFLYCYGIVKIGGNATLRRRLIVEYNKIKIELMLPLNHRTYYSFEKYECMTKPIIVEFQEKINYLRKNKEIKSFINKKTENQNIEFDSEKFFNTIEHYLKEYRKNATPILYTGMKN